LAAAATVVVALTTLEWAVVVVLSLCLGFHRLLLQQ
jgi:hypothetical protein